MTQSIPVPRRNIIFGFSLVIDVIILDQLTKWLMQTNGPIPLLGDWFRFAYTENKGIAFSLPLQGIFQQVVTVLLILFLLGVVLRYKTWQRTLLHFSLMAILGGAIGNAIDRLWRGYVIDFIQVGTFPVFNVADSFVTIGVLGILLYELWWKPRLSERQTTTSQFPHQP